jgi:ketosteroid isomerase-like protein
MVRSGTRATLVGAMVVALVCGCAMFGKGASDEELITRTIEGYSAALAAKDIDGVMAAYSEDFQGEGGGDKDAMRQLFEGAIDAGYLDDLEVDDADCQIKIDGETATVGPVEYSSAMGSMSFEFTMKKEADGMWRIIDISGY